MSDELKAAVEAVAWIERNRNTSVQWDLAAFQEFYERDIDALLPLAKMHIAELTARESSESGPATCHPDKPNYFKGFCDDCFGG